AFTLVITGVSSFFVLGLPVLVGGLLVARAFADLERRRIGPVLRRRIARPTYRRAPVNASWFRRMGNPMFVGQYWLDAVHASVVWLVSTVTFSIAVTWWCSAVFGCLYWTFGWALPDTAPVGIVIGDRPLPEALGLGGSLGARAFFYAAFGIFFLGTLPLVMRGLAVAQAQCGRALLSGMAEVRQHISGLEEGKARAEVQREAAVSAEATALRKLERDIHDGPQQRLVRLAMDLGRAQQQWDTDPEAARRITAEALAQTQETITELRALSRGIAPPILTDRGLPSALAALAARSTVDVELDVAEIGRLHPALENTVYFVVAEALANIAKHSCATLCRINVEPLGDRMVVNVTDDGIGGASLAKGHGLAGLADRAQAAGGTLSVTSPLGGPTTITAALPWRAAGQRR
ncbi:MAG: sensor domain-containing protein, partial [Micromonosporaceae bacterium]|nr:sensor domain-containing protein [Micromonosporaceae bacterium]